MTSGVSSSEQLNIQRVGRISRSVNITKFFAMLIAAAMLFAPFAMQSGRAMAAMPAGHHDQSMSKDHCKGVPSADQDGKSSDNSCCAAMCTASVLPTQVRPYELQFSRILAVPAKVTLYRGVLSEISTPPPRAS